MIIVEEFPPNYLEIIAKLPAVKDKTNVIFTYGDTIYNPHEIDVTPDLIAHEQVHEIQQGENIDGWWERYLEDSDFRYRQELEAYRKQWEYIVGHQPRKVRRQLLSIMAGFLSSPMYGSIVTKEEAMEKISRAS